MRRLICELAFTFKPSTRAQVAVWIDDGTDAPAVFRTIALTEAVALRGIGNRPGAMQMNSGYHWPYGRRESVLPVWAHRRLASGAKPFKRVIFQNRTAEGFASGTTSDHSVDDYFCLSFDQALSDRDHLDAVTCASVFSGDKGRYITSDDEKAGYSEPFESKPGQGTLRALSLTSAYPPRRDAAPCGDANCFDHPELAHFPFPSSARSFARVHIEHKGGESYGLVHRPRSQMKEPRG